MRFSVIIIMVSLNMYFEPEYSQKNEEIIDVKKKPKIKMCILQKVRYSTVIIECDVCIGKISVFMNHGF